MRSRTTLRALPRAASAAALLMLSACVVGPDYKTPDLALNAQFHAAPQPAPGAPAPDLVSWWTAFGDPELDRIVARVQTQNLDLAQAGARLSQSRAAAREAGAALLPTISGASDANRVQQSLQSPIGEVAGGLPGFKRDYDLYEADAVASWEIDLFGGLRRAHEAAKADALAAADQAQAARVSLTAEAADAYLTLRALQARLAVARRQETVEEDLVDLLQRRVSQGVAPERDLHTAQAALQAVRAAIPPLTDALEAQFNRLDVLMGAQPGTYRAELETPAATPAPPPLATADGPASLLRRRPDVRAAEQRLAAANARIGAAVSEYYPKISLAGLFGGQSVSGGSVFTAGALEGQAGAALRWRLFDFGRVDAEVAAARGRDAENLAAYRQTVLRAAEEVEDAFTDLGQQQLRADALARQVAELTTARGQAQQAYDQGVISLIEVRDIDRDLLAASDRLAEARGDQAKAAVSVFRALGGGWSGAGV